MKVASILSSMGCRVVTMRPDSPLASVIQRMKLERIGAIVISSDGQRIEGIVSERDIVRALADRGPSIMEPGRRVSEIMTHTVHTCTPEDTVKDLMERMTRLRIRHLPVIEEGRLAGVVSIGDVVKSRIEEVTVEAEVLRDAYMATH